MIRQPYSACKNRAFLAFTIAVLTTQLGFSQTFFAGISELQASEANNTIHLSATADMPFDYQVEILDPNQISIHLINAKLASQLADNQGNLTLAGLDSVTQGKLVTDAKQQEAILLQGPGISQKTIVLDGGNALEPIANQSPSQTIANTSPAEQVTLALLGQATSDTNAAKTIENPYTANRHTDNIQLARTSASPRPQIAMVQNIPLKSGLSSETQETDSQKETEADAVRTPNRGSSAQIIEMPSRRTSPVTSPTVYQVTQGKRAITIGSVSSPNTTPSNKLSTPAEMYMRQALTLFKENNYSGAMSELQKALLIQPQNPTLYAALGEIHLKSHRPSQAYAAYSRAAELAPDRYALVYARVLYDNHQRVEAIAQLKRVVDVQPSSAEAYELLGTTYDELGQSSEAIRYLEQAQQLNPDSAEIHYRLGLVYEMEGQRDEAKVQYSEAVRLNPTAQNAAKALDRISG